MREKKNEDCETFNIFTGEDEAHLINIGCLNKKSRMFNPELPEMMPRGEVQIDKKIMADDDISTD